MKLRTVFWHFLVLAIAIFFTSICFGQADKSKIVHNEKSQIVESILQQFLEDYPDEIHSDEIVLSSLNIGSQIVPKHTRVKFHLLSPEEIDTRAMREGFFGLSRHF